MTTTTPIRTALLSVFDKTGVVDLGQALHQRGVKLLSTGGTYKALQDAGLPVVEVAEHTGFPEMMDGRVKTLHPKIHGGLLARRDDEAHLASADEHGIDLIDLVVINLYPFEATCDQPGATTQDKIEKIDIGGPSMLRSAAKNHASVTVVTDPSDYATLLEELASNDGATTLAFRQACARQVFRVTGRYDALIAEELTRIAAAEDTTIATTERYPQEIALPLEKVQDCRYGENPHQSAAFYRLRVPGLNGIGQAEQLSGKALSYNNLMDADGAWELVREFSEPAVAVIKHTNPCGCAVDTDLATAFDKAWAGDPMAAFGSIVALNRPLNKATAEKMVEPGKFIEAVIAPSFDADAKEILTTVPKWKNSVRLLAIGACEPAPAETRYVKNMVGGILIQDMDRRGWEPENLEIVTKRAPTAAELRDLHLAWIIVKHLKSNAICLVKDGVLVGPGTGQMSRVNSSTFAGQLAGDRAEGSVLASDAFFPFPDGVEAAAKAGATAIVQPGGSKGDPAVIETADKLGLAMVFTGVRHFRH
jgi:phosphoribosylaminoimidazolecarboxamide formyltransferase/IMP cyclohydrolase